MQLHLNNPKSRILVTAGSNSVCDTIAMRLCEITKNERFVNNLCQSTEFLLRIYSKSAVRKVSFSKLPKEILKRSNLVRSQQKYPAVEDIHKHGIIICTLCTVAKLVTGDVGRGQFFTHIFIDEAASITEPETLLGIVGIMGNSSACRLILSGDHKQLGPVLQSGQAASMGLQRSLMERLMNQNTCYALDENGNYDHTLQSRLRRNFRSHPEIVRLYNTLYYNKELIAGAELGKNIKLNKIVIS